MWWWIVLAALLTGIALVVVGALISDRRGGEHRHMRAVNAVRLAIAGFLLVTLALLAATAQFLAWAFG